MDALKGEVAQPVLHVKVVQTAVEGFVSKVDLTVLDQHRLDGVVLLVLLKPVVEHLGVVRQDSFRWVSEDEKQLDVWVHLVDPFRDLG